MEILGALVNAVFLLALCFSIFVEAITRLREPEPIKDPLQILIVGSIGFLFNIVGIFMFHSTLILIRNKVDMLRVRSVLQG